MSLLRRSLVVLALVAVSCGGSPSTETSTTGGSGVTTTTAAGDSAYIDADAGLTGLSAELSAIRNANGGVLPLADSLDLFASTFGDVPGADSSRFEGRPGDGTMALFAVGAHWEELSAEQQQAVLNLLGYTTAQTFRAPVALGDTEALQAQIDSARAAIAGFVGEDLAFPVVGEVIPDLTVGGRRVLGVAIPERGGVFVTTGRPDRCHIQFTADPAPNATTVAHEVFHCFQFQLGPDLADAFVSGAWIIEGSAEWAGAKVGGVDDGIFEHFSEWRSNTGSVFGLDYNAIGFYWVIESMGVSPWSVIGEMLAADGVDAVAATGLDPGDVLNRVATSLARRNQSPTIPVSDVWDFSVAGVPPVGVRHEETVTTEHAFEAQLGRSNFARGGIALLTLEGGERVQVRVQSDVGTAEFFGKDAVEWEGSINREFCLEDGGCRCGVDGAVDPGLGEGSRELAVAAGALGGGPITYLVRIPDPEGAFTDGHWEGTITSSVFVVNTSGTTGTRHETTAAMEFTIENGAVTSGSYGVSYFISFLSEGGTTGEGTSSIAGVFAGCGFSPQLVGTSFAVDAVLHIPDVGAVPLVFDDAIPAGTSGPGTVWVIDPVTDPNRRSGEVDVSAYVDLVRSFGYGASDVVFTFEATRTG